MSAQDLLKQAVLRGDVNAAKAAIVAHANPLEVDAQGDTLLHLATDRGHPRMVELLCQAGVSVNAQNLRGRTPMHECMFLKHDRDAIERTLLANGARLDLRDEDRLTAPELHEHLVVARARMKWLETHPVHAPTQGLEH